jgi:hypothetical protein
MDTEVLIRQIQGLIRPCVGTPETKITAPPGTLACDSQNGKIYKKGSGTGNTGWVELTGGGGGAVTSVNTYVGAVVLAKADIGLSNADNTSDVNKPVSTAQAAADALKVTKAGDSMSGALANSATGSAAANVFSTRAAGNGIYSSAANTLDLASNGTQGISMTGSVVNVQTTREVRPLGGLLLQAKVRAGIYRPVKDDLAGDGYPSLNAAITNVATSFTIDDSSLWEPVIQALTSGQFSILVTDGVNSEWMVVSSFTAGAPATLNVRRNLTGAGSFAFAAGATVFENAFGAGGNVYDNVVIPTDTPILTSLAGTPLNGNITLWTPPRGTLGSWVKPAQDGRIFYISIRDMNGFTVTIKDPDSRSTLLSLNNTATKPAGVDLYFDLVNGAYAPMGSYKEV